LIGLCGTVITVVLNPDLITAIMGIVAPHPDTFTISVQVADKSGSAVHGAKVLFFYPAGDLGQYTDSYGGATFTVNNAGQGNIRIVVESDDYQVFEKRVLYPIENMIEVRLEEKEATNENVVLRTVTEDNKPIANSEIAVSVEGSIYRETTDSDGFAVLSLPFLDSGKIDTRISVSAKGYELKDQFGTLTPGKLQYVLLSQNSLTVEVPDIPIFASTSIKLPTEAPLPVSGGVIGSGAEMYQVAGDKGLKTVMLNPDSTPWVGAGVTVYEQKTDAVGKPSLGNRVWAGYGRINLQGEFWVDVQDGVYASCPEQPGYGWTENGCVYNIQVVTGSQAVVKVQSGRIQVTIVDASGNPWEGVWTDIYIQKQNAVGEFITSSKVLDGRTNNAGILDVWLTPGRYAVNIDLDGYNWGNLTDEKGKADVIVNKGETTSILISMGQIIVGLIDSSGTPRQDVWMEIYTQKTDVNGNPVLDSRVWDGRTDNGGLATIGLTQGLYAIKIDGEVIYNIPVTWGTITQFDGKTYTQNK
jgi:5-hydroxyisourate hydrolase-like protein (transthyretin family)